MFIFVAKRRRAFLDLLLEWQKEKGEKELSDNDIREEVDTFMFEGHDTTSTNISFILYALAANPDSQAKVHAELDGIFGNDKERQVTSKDLPEMKYLDCVIKETLRLYPSVPFVQRTLTDDLEIGKKHSLYCGTNRLVNLLAVTLFFRNFRRWRKDSS
jgi:cytochrome P450 family 4